MRILKNLVYIVSIGILITACGKDENPSSGNENTGADSIDAPEGYKLVWQDEFNGTTIDRDKWGFEVNASGGGNNELQYYLDREENAYVEDGYLHIVARQEEYTGPEGTRYYTSARMRTAGKGDWKYGIIRVRARIPYGDGMWPAIWMLSTDWEYGGWPESGEIDIMEHVGFDPGKIHGSVHTKKYYHKIGTQKTAQIMAPNADSIFYVYSLEWTEDSIKVALNGKTYFTFANDHQGDFETWPFDKKFHLLLNVAVGGDWPGPPTTNTKFPKEMVVDYVRVFQKVN